MCASSNTTAADQVNYVPEDVYANKHVQAKDEEAAEGGAEKEAELELGPTTTRLVSTTVVLHKGRRSVLARQ